LGQELRTDARPRATSRVAVRISIAVAASLVLAGCSSTSNEPSVAESSVSVDLGTYYSQPVTWSACKDGFQCASFTVPLNYSDPASKPITIEMLKAPATNPNKRRGAIVVNPGGPGGSGVDFARNASGTVSSAIMSEYDIVGFDPRGVGKSTPIDCLDGPQTDTLVATLGTPQSPAQEEQAVASAASLGAGCAANSPELTPNIGTIPAARDMDILRGVLGESSLNFLGLSYGTFLGLTYADLFTDKVGQFVLDGVINPDLTNDELARGQAEGFQLALSSFIADCPTHTNCPLPTDPAAATKKIDDWLTSVGNDPIEGSAGRPLTRPLATNGIIGSLYEPQFGWWDLRSALRAGFKGNGTPLMRIVDSFTGRQPDGTYSGNSLDALYAVNCLDRTDRADPQRTLALGEEWASTAPTFGRELAWSNLPCFDYPAPPTNEPHVITAEGGAPILLVGTTRDPATPYVWAKVVNDQLASSVLVTFDGDGHTGYGRNSCVTQAVDQAFLTGQLPDDDITCV
jgi:pimeloyl-ACP methyl ester carboxylesterase